MTEVKPVKRIPNLAAKKTWGLRLNWLCYGAMLLLIAAESSFAEHGTIGLWIIQSFPLLLPLYGMLKGSHRAYSWLCFITLFYFTLAVVNVGMPSEFVTAYHVLSLLLSISLFFTAMLASRWLQYFNYWQQQDPSEL